jgi:DNA-directed RNA polymerase subunit RPC12/RpoP
MAGQAETIIRQKRLQRSAGIAEGPGRATLRLKHAPALPPIAPPVVAAPQPRWKCKPCGATFEVSPSLDGADAVRCPACNARLGRAEQFRGDPADVRGVRARAAGRP